MSRSGLVSERSKSNKPAAISLARPILRDQIVQHVLVNFDDAAAGEIVAQTCLEEGTAVARLFAFNLIADGGALLGQLGHIGRNMLQNLSHHRAVRRADRAEQGAIGPAES